MIKKALTLLFMLWFIPGMRAEENLQVRDFRCEPSKVMSGEEFHIYATVVNLSENPVDTEIILCLRSAPDGFYGHDDVIFGRFNISLPGFGETEIQKETSIIGEDERWEFYFRQANGDIISDYCPLQLGECGSIVTRVELATTQVSMRVGTTDSVLASVYPGSAPQEVTWTVKHPDVIRILEYYETGNQGVIFEGIKAGETDLVVTTTNGLSAVCHVTVDDPVKAESISVFPSVISGAVGDTFLLAATTLPAGNDAIVVYSSGNDKVATVGREDGIVTITGPGSTSIYAWATPSVGFVQATCLVSATMTGIDDSTVTPAEDLVDVYSFDGTLIVHKATFERINQLPYGCYILHYPDKTIKIVR